MVKTIMDLDLNPIISVDTHEQSSWYFKPQASPDLKLWLL